MKKITFAIGTVITAVIISGIIASPYFARSQTTSSPIPTNNSSSLVQPTATVQLLGPRILPPEQGLKTLNLRGKIVSDGNVRITATIAATVKEILISRGQTIKKGDVLMHLGGSKDNKHQLEIAYDQALLSKQNIETSIQNTAAATNVSIRQAEQQRNTLNTSAQQLQKSLELTRNAGNYAIQGANLALNNLQNTITRSQTIHDLSSDQINATLNQTKDLAHLAVQNTARSLLISLKGTVLPLLGGINAITNNSSIHSDANRIQDIADNLSQYADISLNRIEDQINELNSQLYNLLDVIDSISEDLTKIDSANAKPLIDAWKPLSGTITSSATVSITQLSTTRNQITNGPTNKDLQLASPESQISASQDQQRVLEMSISQAQNAAALQEQTLNSQIQTIEQQKITANLAIEAAKAAAKSQKDTIQGQLNIANKQLEQAQNQLNQLVITANMDGYIVDVPVTVNEDVSTGRELVTIYGTKPDFIRLSISPSDRDQIKTGQKLLISLTNDTTKTLPATIENIAMISDSSGNIPVDCTFDNMQTLPLGFVPGSNVQARSISDQATDNNTASELTNLVPVSAIVIDNNQSYVWLYEQGHLHKTPVHIGPSQNDQVHILDNLDWSNIVTNPATDFVEGESVAISAK